MSLQLDGSEARGPEGVAEGLQRGGRRGAHPVGAQSGFPRATVCGGVGAKGGKGVCVEVLHDESPRSALGRPSD